MPSGLHGDITISKRDYILPREEYLSGLIKRIIALQF